MYKRFLSSWVVILLIAAAAACSDDAGEPSASPSLTTTDSSGRGGSHGPGVTETEIRLGMTNDLTGTADTPYGGITVAMQAYFRKVSEEDGGVCGRRVVLLAEDDQYLPEAALAKTKKLVEQDQVLAIVGSLGTVVHAQAATYLNDPNGDGNPSDGVPDIFLSTGWSGWGDVAKYPWTIGFIPDYITDGRVLTRYANDGLKEKKIGVLYQGNESWNEYARALQETISNQDLLVFVEPADSSPEGLKSHVLALRDAAAEVVMLALPPERTAEVYRIADAEGYSPKWLLSYANSPSALAREIGGGIQADQLLKGFEELNGSVSTAYLLSPIDNAQSPPMLEHQRIMETYDGPVVSTLSVYGQSLAETVLETLRRSCESITREKVLRAAESLQGFRTSLMLEGIVVNLGPEDHRAIDSLQLIEVQADGTLKAIGDPVGAE